MKATYILLFAATLQFSCAENHELAEDFFADEEYEKAEFYFEKALNMDRGELENFI